MNEIILNGKLEDIQFSHYANDIQYDKAFLTDINGNRFPVKFKHNKILNLNSDNDISIKGNLRSYSQKISETKNKVDIYIFSNFDDLQKRENKLTLDGRICKINKLKQVNNKPVLHFIIANNIITPKGSKINNYIPCVAFDDIAIHLSSLKVSDLIEISGFLNCREYTKCSDDTEQKLIAYEVVINGFDLSMRASIDEF